MPKSFVPTFEAFLKLVSADKEYSLPMVKMIENDNRLGMGSQFSPKIRYVIAKYVKERRLKTIKPKEENIE